jgi:hypothetical protein
MTTALGELTLEDGAKKAAGIANVAWRLENDFALTDGWEIELYSWLSENNHSAVENAEDHGGCPSEEELEKAIQSLGFKRKP